MKSKRAARTGVYEGTTYTHGSFGQQYTTISGQKFITYFNLLDPSIKGLVPGVMVEYQVTEGPTILRHSPEITEPLPSANLTRVITKERN